MKATHNGLTLEGTVHDVLHAISKLQWEGYEGILKDSACDKNKRSKRYLKKGDKIIITNDRQHGKMLEHGYPIGSIQTVGTCDGDKVGCLNNYGTIGYYVHIDDFEVYEQVDPISSNTEKPKFHVEKGDKIVILGRGEERGRGMHPYKIGSIQTIYSIDCAERYVTCGDGWFSVHFDDLAWCRIAK